jgi:hypothetical protein
VHQVGFITRIFRDARLTKHKIFYQSNGQSTGNQGNILIDHLFIFSAHFKIPAPLLACGNQIYEYVFRINDSARWSYTCLQLFYCLYGNDPAVNLHLFVKCFSLIKIHAIKTRSKLNCKSGEKFVWSALQRNSNCTVNAVNEMCFFLHLVVYLLSSLYSTPVCRFRHMSYDLSPTILTLKWLRKEHNRSLRIALFCRNM